MKIDDQCPDARLVIDIVNRIDVMSKVLYEIKTESPLGKTIKILIGLFDHDGKIYPDGTICLRRVSLNALAGQAEISEADLKESLDYLQRLRIILYCQAPVLEE